jgi:membrane-associated phospholipid phosphatase
VRHVTTVTAAVSSGLALVSTTDPLVVGAPKWFTAVGVSGWPTTVGVSGWPTVAAAVATQLAETWFLFVLLSLGYWIAPRVTANPRAVGATLIAVALGALAASLGLKAGLAVPRPPGATTATVPDWFPSVAADVLRTTATADGYGFPSGHVLAATAVYGGFVTFLDTGTRRRRLLVAGGVVALVGASRIALGLHTVGDVAGGVVCGAATLWLFVRVTRPGFRPAPDRAFFLAGTLGLLAVAVGLARWSGLLTDVAAIGQSVVGIEQSTVGVGQPAAAKGETARATVGAGVAAGGGVGGYLVWRLRGPEDAVVGLGGVLPGLVLAAGSLGYAGTVVTDGVPVVVGLFRDTVSLRVAAAGLAAGAAVALVVAWPTVLDRVRPFRLRRG